jgi:hypothetical protein
MKYYAFYPIRDFFIIIIIIIIIIIYIIIALVHFEHLNGADVF